MKNFLVLTLLCSFALAESNTPKLSLLGRKRVEKNIVIVDGNLAALKENIEAIRQNIAIVKKEITELDQLRKESLTLNREYRAYLQRADVESRKNKLAKQKITAWKRRSLASVGNNPELRKKTLSQADEELNNRLAWDRETKAKKLQASKLLNGLRKTQNRIRGQRAKLLKELNNWSRRQREYANFYRKMETKKRDYLRMLARQ